MPALPPAVRVDLGDIVLRRLTVDDAHVVAAAVADNLDHLRPWMPWANAESDDDRFQRRRFADAERRSGPRDADFGYGLVRDGRRPPVAPEPSV